MSREVADAAVDFLFNECGQVSRLSIYFTGGEPLMNFPVMKHVVETSTKLAASKGKKVSFGMSTNGTIMTEEIASFITDNRIGVQISLDGPPEVQNAARPLRDGSDSFDLVAANLATLKQAGFNASIAAVCHHNNLNMCGTFDYLMKSAPVSVQVTMSQCNPGSPWGFSEEDIPAIRREVQGQFDQVWDGVVRGQVVPNNLVWKFMSTAVSGIVRADPCGAGRNTLAIGPNGGIYPCTLFAGLEQFKLADVWQPGEWRNRIRTLDILNRPASGPCTECWGRGYCAGSCPFERWDREGASSLTPHPSDCQFYLICLDESLRLLARAQTSQEEIRQRFQDIYRKTTSGKDRPATQPDTSKNDPDGAAAATCSSE